MFVLMSKFAWKATQHIAFLVESVHSELLGGMVHWALMSALQHGCWCKSTWIQRWRDLIVINDTEVILWCFFSFIHSNWSVRFLILRCFVLGYWSPWQCNLMWYKQYWYKWYHLYLLYHVRLHFQTCMYCSQQTLACHTQVHTEVQMCYTLLDWSPKSFNRLFKQTLGTE